MAGFFLNNIKNDSSSGNGINIATFEIGEDGNLYCLTPNENTGNITYSINKDGELEAEING